MQIVYGTQFENYLASGVDIANCLEKVKTHYSDMFKEDISWLYAQLADAKIEAEFGNLNSISDIEEITEQIGEVQRIEVLIRQAKNISALQKILEKEVDDGIEIRKVS